MTQLRWLAPSPLWDDLLGKPAGFRAPALLRFAGDDFIEQYQRVLSDDPRELRGYVARPESWRVPAAGLDAPGQTPTRPLRLYQPVHGRYYLVAATLACRVPGLPEHTVDVAEGETVGFVLRRITVAAASGAETGEWAWVERPDGHRGWVRATAAALAAGEAPAPMFGTGYPGEGKRTRRVFAGLVPASRREELVNGRELDDDAPPPPAEEPRLVDFQRAVIDPWASMKERWDEVLAQLPAPTGAQKDAERTAMESASAMMLIDFAEFLERSTPTLWTALAATGGAPPGLSAGEAALFAKLDTQRMWSRTKLIGGAWTMRQALREAHRRRADFDALVVSESAQPTVPSGFRPVLWVDPATPNPYTGPTPPYDPDAEMAALLALLTRDGSNGDVLDRPLARLVRDALGTAPAGAVPPQLPALPPADADEWFVVRCVYQRPRCGRGAPPAVSDRSERFRLTSFFDPDAPARQLRVAMPVDTSPAALRRYDRNVAFVLSDQLRKQMSRASSLKDLMDGKAGGVKPGLDIGVICSFSIPIITICALILLMILVSLLNIVFWWLPLFKVCFPVPKPKS